MTGAYPHDALSDVPCPVAALFADERAMCRGKECPLLREAPMVTDGPWLVALSKLADEIEDKSPTKVKAAKMIAANPEAYGLVRRFYCGLGGEPRA